MTEKKHYKLKAETGVLGASLDVFGRPIPKQPDPDYIQVIQAKTDKAKNNSDQPQ
jgi:hypothetical protein